MSKEIKVSLVGNPNTGKTSIFNSLTGLNQKIGNYPGVTVDKKEGIYYSQNGTRVKILDLPGIYSLNATSADEHIVVKLLTNSENKDFPDLAVIISDIENLKRNLFLFTQVKDLKIPCLLVINMIDVMEKKGVTLNIPVLEKKLNTKIALVSARKNIGVVELKRLIENYKDFSKKKTIDINSIDSTYFKNLKKLYPDEEIYKLWVLINQIELFNEFKNSKIDLSRLEKKSDHDMKRLQQKEAIKRYQFINDVLKEGLKIDSSKAKDFRNKLDKILTHRIWGYTIFFALLLLIFQAIYDWATVPMDFIDSAFASLAEWIKTTFPAGGKVTALIAEGLISGIGGVVIFIPQIAFLFLFISILEETGYMSRVVFLMDRIMRRFGVSGKSVVPLISGTACAIPAIMATRNIENWKERLITILVTPFMTCSARLPVYLIIIALVIPDGKLFGLSYQALALMLLYLIGLIMAIFSAFLLDKIIRSKRKKFFVIEMPNYRLPLFKNVFITVIEKTKIFVFEAGKIILSISIILWVMASYGPNKNFDNAEIIITEQFESLSGQELEDKVSAHKLENSFIGIIGKSIEPVIKPLGYDWKIGIALVTSFAAREVFVGTLATIYSVGSAQEDESIETIKQKMLNEQRSDGTKVFTIATGISLLIFYAFAMQCMSTLAIVKRETKSWKWPLLQLLFMTIIAYISALICYQVLS